MRSKMHRWTQLNQEVGYNPKSRELGTTLPGMEVGHLSGALVGTQISKTEK